MKHLKLLIEIAFVLVMFLSTGASASVSNAISSYHKISAVREKALAEISMAQKNLFAFPEKSFSDANRAKMLADNLKDENLQGRSLMLMGISLYRLYRFDEANNYFLKANKMFVKTNNLRGQINILKYQGVIQSDQGLYKKSFPFFDEAINLSKKIKNDTITVDLIILNGYVHVFNSDLNNSFLNFDNAYQIARNSKKLSLIARSSLALGDWYNANGNFKSAIDFYHKAAIICDSLNDRGGYIWAMNKLGMLFAGWQRYSDALDYLRKALSKSDDNHLLSGSGLTQRNLGEVYISKGQYHEALQNYLTAYNLEKISGNRPGMAESLCGEAEVLLNDNQIIRVKNILDSIKILVKGNYDPTIHAAINRISGLYHIKTTNYSQARVDLLNAVKLAKNYDQARLRLSAIHDLKMLCEKEKNYAEAYRYTLQYNALSDSVFNIRIHSQLMEKRMIFRNDEIRQQIESLKSVNREDLATVYNHNQIVWKQRLLMFIGIIGSIIFSVLLVLIIKHNRTIKKVNKLLNERNYQLVIQKDQINESIQKAKQSEKLQSAFLANMSHEIRTPMNAIMGFSELLGLDDVEEEESEQFIDHIISNSEILLDIMDNIIDIARLDGGQIALSFARCRVDEILLELKDAFSLRLNTYKNRDKVILKLKLPSDIKGLELYTDRMRLNQILSNLLDNALKFTECGNIEFGIEGQGENLLQFYVKDTGIGIEPENKEIIFSRFRQVEDSFTRRYGGVGLGLSITKSLVDLLGGNIWVESTLNQGSVFHFTHPINEVNPNTLQFKKSRRIFRDSLAGIQTARAHSYYFRKP